ncbi:MAG: TonB-dependent receptor [Massilibacteroides sp.]|nr:TonB-dependent receptor [Massilibacteroides sp.]
MIRHKKHLFFYIFFYLVVCTPLLGYAQVDTIHYHPLKEVTITKRRKVSTTLQRTPLQRFNIKELETLGIDNLSEAIKHFSGVTIRDYGGIGGLKTVSIRGLGAAHTAVAYDGITVSNTQGGQIDISRFSLDNVDQVSLNIGQSDNLFQTARMFASSGALSIRSSAPDFSQKATRIKANLRAGSFGWFNPFLQLDQRINKTYGISLQGNWMRADSRYPFTLTNGNLVTKEKRKNSDIKTLHAEINGYADWDTYGKLKVKGYFFDSKKGLPGSIVLYNDYQKERLYSKDDFVQANYEVNLHPKLTLKANAKFDYAWTQYQDFHSAYKDGVMTDIYTQREYYGSMALRYQVSTPFEITFAQDAFYNTLDATTPLCPFPERFTSLSALSASYKIGELNVSGSLLGTYITETIQIGTPAPDRKKISPMVSLSYKIFREHNLRVRFSYQDHFRTPTFNDLYYDRIGNKNLNPEKAHQFNVGLTWNSTAPSINMNILRLTLDGYYNQVTDKIVAIPTMFVWKMMNMDKVNITGIDATLSSNFSITEKIKLDLRANYSYQHAVDRTKKGSKTYGDQIPYTPCHSGSGSISVQMPWLTVGWSLNGVSKRYIMTQNIASNLLKGYTEQQLTLNHLFTLNTFKIRLRGEILNLTDTTYDVIKYYPMPGRSYRFGIQFIY